MEEYGILKNHFFHLLIKKNSLMMRIYNCLSIHIRRLAIFGLSLLIIGACIAQKKMDTTAKGNPFIRHMYTADPSAHVWADGRLYVYASHDIYPARGCDLMDQYN